MLQEEILKDAERRMRKSIDALKSNLAKLRTGRAHPSLLEPIEVAYYGNPTPLSQVASISVLDARTLSISPWEKHLVPAIEKAILQSGLGLNPVTVGELIRIPLPPLTEERRREMTKVVRHEAEDAKVSIRNVRRDANTHLKDLEKQKELTEDLLKKAEDRVQKLTDQTISEVESISSEKEKELMAV